MPLFGFGLMALGLSTERPFGFDLPVLLWMREQATPALDSLSLFLAAVGYRYGVVPLDVAIVLGLALARRWREAGFAASAFIGAALLNMGAKAGFQRERPGLWDGLVHEPTFSFPSGHAMGSATLALVVIALAWSTRWRWQAVVVAGTFAALVGVSRVYLGVHYPSDIVAGWSLAIAWGVLMLRLWWPLTRRAWPPR